MAERFTGSVAIRRSGSVPCQWGILSRNPCAQLPTTRVEIAEAYGGGYCWYCADHIGSDAVREAVLGRPLRAARVKPPRPARMVRDRHIAELVAGGKSLEAVGLIYGLTRQRVHQIVEHELLRGASPQEPGKPQ